MELTGADLALVSEGSFGAHPTAFFLPANEEWLVLLDIHFPKPVTLCARLIAPPNDHLHLSCSHRFYNPRCGDDQSCGSDQDFGIYPKPDQTTVFLHSSVFSIALVFAQNKPIPLFFWWIP